MYAPIIEKSHESIWLCQWQYHSVYFNKWKHWFWLFGSTVKKVTVIFLILNISRTQKNRILFIGGPLFFAEFMDRKWHDSTVSALVELQLQYTQSTIKRIRLNVNVKHWCLFIACKWFVCLCLCVGLWNFLMCHVYLKLERRETDTILFHYLFSSTHQQKWKCVRLSLALFFDLFVHSINKSFYADASKHMTRIWIHSMIFCCSIQFNTEHWQWSYLVFIFYSHLKIN